jgi:NADH:ubiquinone oxidoreductase subunit E
MIFSRTWAFDPLGIRSLCECSTCQERGYLELLPRLEGRMKANKKQLQGDLRIFFGCFADCSAININNA